jgi:hypothetical protein
VSFSTSPFSRRAVLRGAGVAITLPFLESLFKPAKALAAAGPKRFIAVSLPNGAPNFWTPLSTGAGASWQLSSVLAPLAAHKSKTIVLSNLETGSVFNADGSASVEPSHGRLSAAWLSCMDPEAVRLKLGLQPGAITSGITVDQIMAAHENFAGLTDLPSLQTGLSSCQSFCDGRPCDYSRSVSWLSETQAMFKMVDPQAVFDKLVGVWPETNNEQAAALRDARMSVLDGVLTTSTSLRTRLSAQDKQRLDEFLDSVREVEKKVQSQDFANGCVMKPQAPTFPPVGPNFRQDGGGYTKSGHADLMHELIALALQCDRTRIVTHMFEDERSEYTYDFLSMRTFTATTSAQATGTCPEWHGGGQHGSNDSFATIVHWHVAKLAELCARLASMPEGEGSVLDNTVIFLGACMQGATHLGNQLPALLIGGGGGALKTDQHIQLAKRPLRDLHYTLMNGVYDMNVSDFGMDRTGAPIATISEILA